MAFKKTFELRVAKKMFLELEVTVRVKHNFSLNHKFALRQRWGRGSERKILYIPTCTYICSILILRIIFVSILGRCQF